MEKNIPAKILMRRIKSLESSLKISGDYSKKLESRVRSLETQKKMLMDEEKKKSESARKNIMESREIALRESLIMNLRGELEALRKKFSRIGELEMISADGCVPVIPVKSFDRESILESDAKFGVNGSVIFFSSCKSDPSAFRTLVSLQPKAVIADLEDGDAAILENAEIKVMPKKSVRLAKYIEFLGAKREELDMG